MTVSGPPPAARPATPASDCGSPQFDAAEVHALLWALRGGVRRAAAWSLCARHAWGLTLAECELGEEALPVSRMFLAHCLLRGRNIAASRLPAVLARSRLRGRACPVCSQAAQRGPEAGSMERRERVNDRTRFEALAAASRDEWERGTCPLCLSGAGPPCRPHLVSGAPIPIALAGSLGTLATQVADHAPGAWLQGVGWLAGWGLRDRSADPTNLRYFGHPIAAVESPRERLRRIVREALDLQDEASGLIAAISRDEPLRELAPRGGPVVSRFEELRRELPAKDDTAMGRLAAVLDSVLAHHAMLVNTALDTLAVNWRSEAMRDELHRLESMGHMAEVLEDVADLLAVRR